MTLPIPGVLPYAAKVAHAVSRVIGITLWRFVACQTIGEGTGGTSCYNATP